MTILSTVLIAAAAFLTGLGTAIYFTHSSVTKFIDGVHDEIEDIIDLYEEQVEKLRDSLLKERALSRGLQESLHDAAVTKSNRIG